MNWAKETNYIPPPAETVEELLSERRIGREAFAGSLNLSESQYNKFRAGDLPISKTMSVQLESIFGVSADFWLRLENQYRLWRQSK